MPSNQQQKSPPPTSSSPSSNKNSNKMFPTTLENSLEKDERMKEMHTQLEDELVTSVSVWSHRVLVYGTGGAAMLLKFNGQDNYINPAIVSAVAVLASYLFPTKPKTQLTISLIFIAVAIVKHALSQGCTASLVPAIYGFLPCAFGFLFRSPQAVIYSTGFILFLTSIIFAVDLSDQCVTQPISNDEKGYIVADRLVPLLMLILGNAFVLIAIVRQSQESLILHAKATRSAAKLAEVRRDVLHRVTHELRTPLNGIVGSVELLTTSDTMNPQDLENAMTVKSCLHTIIRICDDVLLAAKAKKATAEIRKRGTIFNIASCIDDVAEMFAATAVGKGIALKVKFVGNTTTAVRGMEVELRQVLLNLVGNGIKFTDSGSVTIRVTQQQSQQEQSQQEQTLHQLEQYLFEIQDTGIGITESEIGEGNASMLFEPFHQGEQGGAVSRRHKGTGLGLTISKDLVELMGGMIAVDGRKNHGARFYFTLNLQKELWASSTTQQRGERIVESGNNENNNSNVPQVLIVDTHEECAACCQSVVMSVIPSANIHPTLSSHKELASFLNDLPSPDENKDTTASKKLCFLQCETLTTEEIQSTLSLLQNKGWIVFPYCDQKTFPQMVTECSNYRKKGDGCSGGGVYAMFRRPLPLVRLGDSILDALEGKDAPGVGAVVRPDHQGCIRKDGVHRNNNIEQCISKKEVTQNNTAEKNCRELENTSGATKIVGVMQSDTVTGPIEPSSVIISDSRLSSNNNGNENDHPNSNGGAAGTAAPAGSKIVVVDDTPINVKVLVKMLARATNLPVASCYDGQSAIELVAATSPDDEVLLLMDWHMPGIDGLSATDSIRKFAQSSGGPNVFVVMVTADTEGLYTEMGRRDLSFEGTVSKGAILRDAVLYESLDDSGSNCSSDEGNHRRRIMKSSSSSSSFGADDDDDNMKKKRYDFAVVDLIADKPVTFKSIRTILDWFQQKQHQRGSGEGK